jgi:hypothetical protein
MLENINGIKLIAGRYDKYETARFADAELENLIDTKAIDIAVNAEELMHTYWEYVKAVKYDERDPLSACHGQISENNRAVAVIGAETICAIIIADSIAVVENCDNRRLICQQVYFDRSVDMTAIPVGRCSRSVFDLRSAFCFFGMCSRSVF